MPGRQAELYCYAFDSSGVTYLIALLLESRYDRVSIKQVARV